MPLGNRPRQQSRVGNLDFVLIKINKRALADLRPDDGGMPGGEKTQTNGGFHQAAPAGGGLGTHLVNLITGQVAALQKGGDDKLVLLKLQGPLLAHPR